MAKTSDSHSLLMGYLLWIFGILGAHRFYYGRPISGTIWFFTFGLLGVGWLLDLFLMPFLARDARAKYCDGEVSYNMSWILLTFLGVFGAHRLYLGKVFTAILYFFTVGVFGLGILYDYWTLNEQVSEVNADMRRVASV